MHYYRHYSDLKGKTKRDKAIADCKEYLGNKHFASLGSDVRDYYRAEGNKLSTIKIVQRSLSFAGIQGYPAKAWAIQLASEAKRI